MRTDLQKTKFVESHKRLSEKHGDMQSTLDEYAGEIFDRRQKEFVKSLKKTYPPRLLRNALAWYSSLPDIQQSEIPIEECVIQFAGEHPELLTNQEKKLVIQSAKSLPEHPLDRDIPEPEFDGDSGEFRRKKAVKSSVSSEQFKKLSSSEMKKIIERSSKK